MCIEYSRPEACLGNHAIGSTFILGSCRDASPPLEIGGTAFSVVSTRVLSPAVAVALEESFCEELAIASGATESASCFFTWAEARTTCVMVRPNSSRMRRSASASLTCSTLSLPVPESLLAKVAGAALGTENRRRVLEGTVELNEGTPVVAL